MTEPIHATVMPSFDKKDIEDNKLVAAIGYIGILCLIPLLLKKESKFCQEHGKQGLILFLFEVIVGAVSMLPFIGWFIIGPIGSILGLVLALICIVKALQGEFWEIPVIGQYRKNVNF